MNSVDTELHDQVSHQSTWTMLMDVWPFKQADELPCINYEKGQRKEGSEIH